MYNSIASPDGIFAPGRVSRQYAQRDGFFTSEREIDMPDQRSLALETSGRLGSVALVQDTSVLVEQTFSHDLKHAAGLLPLIDQLMREHDWKPFDLSYLYVSQGPGSFTGLRISVTLAKTLALVTGARIVPVPSLHVLAMNAPDDAMHALIILDAKRGQIFTARYERNADTWVEREPAHLDSLEAALAHCPRPVHLIGDGIPYHTQFLPEHLDGIHVTTQERWACRASVVARLGMQLADQGIFISADEFVPAYVRKPEAEEKYDKQMGTV